MSTRMNGFLALCSSMTGHGVARSCATTLRPTVCSRSRASDSVSPSGVSRTWAGTDAGRSLAAYSRGERKTFMAVAPSVDGAHDDLRDAMAPANKVEMRMEGKYSLRPRASRHHEDAASGI